MTGWHKSAECASAPTDIWFDPGHERLALQICAECPVREACLTAALEEERGLATHSRHGIRGGLTAAERLNVSVVPFRPVLDDPVLSHGSRTLYRKGCRCTACAEAENAYQRAWHQARRAKAAKTDPEHGTRSRYRHGCRCEDCRAANAAYDRRLRNGGGLGV